MLICPMCEKTVSQFKTNSHIIPEWMYKDADMYDEKGRIIHLDFTNNKKSLLQKGYRGNFICDNCEKETAVLDSYASKYFKSESYPKGFQKQEKFTDKTKQKKYSNDGPERIYLWSGFDFKKIQNFIYSICLRQHFYNLSQNEKGLFIVDKHLDAILKLYRSEDIDDETYPIIIFSFPKESPFCKFIVSPYVDKMDGHFVIQFTACGFLFILKISSHYSKSFSNIIGLNTNGRIYVSQIKPETSGILKKAQLQIRKQFPKSQR